MLMMLQPVELCQNYVSDLIYFAHKVPVLVIILSLQKVFVIINDRWKNEAAVIFGDLGIQVMTGHRFLGGCIGSHSERDEYAMSKV